MANNFWFNRNLEDAAQLDAENALESISSLTADIADSEDINVHYYRGLGGRRRKAAMVFTVVWSSTIALHLVSWGYWFVLGLTTLVGIHFLRILFARPIPTPDPLFLDAPDRLPFVSLLVAAKNEEAVIRNLVKMLCTLDYPTSRYEVWVIDDNSSDRTPLILQQLQEEYAQLRVMRRGPDASGGKSGALNQALPHSQGDIIGVFDADARVPADLLRRVLPLFEREQVGAVQTRKAISQAEDRHNPLSRNFWVQGQMAEMALDSFIQQQRVAIGGIGELRGNSQFVRRTALYRCGGWNEATITDDLDLTIRLHLDGWDIDFLMFPAVQEEGVTHALGLWHQRNRWAEGGYQRYLDYWRLIARNRLGFKKTIDLLVLWLVQYIMPSAAVPDVGMAIARNTFPVLAPLTGLSVTIFFISMVTGLLRIRLHQQRLSQMLHRANHQSTSRVLVRGTLTSWWLAVFQSLRGTLYMFHWFAVMASTTARMAVRPKQLKWVKTTHHGSDDLVLEASESA
jgi:1,2-diacylglycerol 3-beta-glucosyltransferase